MVSKACNFLAQPDFGINPDQGESFLLAAGLHVIDD